MKRKNLAFLIFVSLLFLGIIPRCLNGQEESWENRINRAQPPDRVMEAIGVKSGMVIGEVGAGRGRYTVHLARRVGETGKIYANDIDKTSMEYLRDRCIRTGITNVEIVLGKVDDPLFPKTALDMVLMILTYQSRIHVKKSNGKRGGRSRF